MAHRAVFGIVAFVAGGAFVEARLLVILVAEHVAGRMRHIHAVAVCTVVLRVADRAGSLLLNNNLPVPVRPGGRVRSRLGGRMALSAVVFRVALYAGVLILSRLGMGGRELRRVRCRPHGRVAVRAVLFRMAVSA